jgi:hypothetical protein
MIIDSRQKEESYLLQVNLNIAGKKAPALEHQTTEFFQKLINNPRDQAL